MTSLLKRVQGHCTGQTTSGQNTLALFVECVDHFAGDSGDWTPLATLIGKSQPAQSRVIRALTGWSIEGWSIKKDEQQSSGLRFSKQKNKNQGFNEDRLAKVRALVEGKKSVQSKEVAALFAKPKADLTTLTAVQQKQKIDAAFKRLAESLGLTDTQIMRLHQAKEADLVASTRDSDENVAH